MTLQLARHPRRHAAILPSVGALAVITAVVLANGWSLLSSEPELAPMDALARLDALQGESLPSTALAAAGTPESAARSDARGPALTGAANAGPIRVTAPLPSGPDSDPLHPTVGPTNRVSRLWTVQSGESLSEALAHLHIRGTARDAVIRAYETVRNPTKIQAGWQVWGQFATSGLIDDGELVRLVVAPQSGQGLTVEPQGSAYVAREGGLPGTLVRQALRCGIVGTLEDSLRRCGETEELVPMVASLLADRLVEPIEPRTGDELRLVMDKLVDGTAPVRYHHIAALEYRTTHTTITALWFDSEHDTSGYYDPKGASVERLFLRQPLRTARTTSQFGMRLHPVLHRTLAHYGVDYGAPRGTPVWSVGEGHLISARRAGAAGNLVRVKHDEQYMTEYMHLQRFAPGLKPGERVAKGQVIGYVGSTGRSTGPHLHFGAKHEGRYIDPNGLPDVAKPGVTAREKGDFAAKSRELLGLLESLGRTPGASGT
jgi:hypothetical protein